MRGEGGSLREMNLRRGDVVDLVDEIAEGALQFQGFSGAGAGGFDGEGIFVPQSVDTGGGRFGRKDDILM